MLKTSNPALSEKVFNIPAVQGSEIMTIQGTVNKTIVLLGLLLVAAAWTWSLAFSGASIGTLMQIGIWGGLFTVIATVIKKEWSPVTTPVYALLEGLALGGLSAVFEAQFPGIVIRAVSLTFGTLFALLMAYKSGIIKPTENLKLGIVAATGGIAIVYILDLVLGFFGIRMPMIHGGGFIGIGFSLFVVVIAALNLVLDFDFIEQGSKRGCPKYMEWYGAFGLLVTLVWLYLEILRLLSKLQSRR